MHAVSSLSAPISSNPVASVEAPITLPPEASGQGIEARLHRGRKAAGGGDQAYSYLTYNGKTYYIRHIQDGQAQSYSPEEWDRIKQAVARSLGELKQTHSQQFQDNFHSGHLDPIAKTWSFKTSSGQSQPTVIDKVENLPIFELLQKNGVKAREPSPAPQNAALEPVSEDSPIPPSSQRSAVRKEFLDSLRQTKEAVSLDEIALHLQSRGVDCIEQDALVNKTHPTVRLVSLPNGNVSAFILNPQTKTIHYYDPSGTLLSSQANLQQWAQTLATDGWSLKEEVADMLIQSIADHHYSFLVLRKTEKILHRNPEFSCSDNLSVERERQAYANALERPMADAS